MLAVYLPAEKVLWYGGHHGRESQPRLSWALSRSAVQTFNRLKLDYNTWIPAHPPNPDRPLTRADVMAVPIGTN